jgi:hypothetical protein
MMRNIYLIKKIEKLKLYIENLDNAEFIETLKKRITFLESCLSK